MKPKEYIGSPHQKTASRQWRRIVLPPERHQEIWAAQKPLDFPGFVYGVSRERGEETMPAMEEITRRRSEALGRHRSDQAVR